MKSIAFCGDSWFSIAPELPNTHFSELICNHYDCKLINNSRGNISNFAIALQIEEALLQDPDLFVIGTTDSYRFEIPNFAIKENKFDITDYIPKALTRHKNYTKFDYFTRNIVDVNNLEKSKKNSPLISASIKTLIENDMMGIKIDEKTRKCVEDFAIHMFDPLYKRQIDCWILSNSLRKLVSLNKKFLFFPEVLYINEFKKDIDWLEKKFIVENLYGLYEFTEIESIVYHTTPKIQIEIANQLIKIIDERYKLVYK